MSDVTRILQSIEDGDPQAAEELLPLVYDELRKLAAAKMAQENPGQTLQATALVHEAYLRLVESERRGSSPPNSAPPSWNSRGHFFAAAGEAMRRILVERARRKQSRRHGGDRLRIELNDDLLPEARSLDDVLAINDALQELAKTDAQAAQLVTLRYFAGSTIPEAAEILGVSPRTADSIWAYARAWLFEKIHAQ
jgi:RNA polymerase sigma factor (TIGR02999 family)